MTLNRPIRIVLALLLLPAAVACQRGNDPVPATTDPGPAAAAAPISASIVLPSAFSRRETSPISQLATSLGCWPLFSRSPRYFSS
mgnify:CR=1 FL=1